MMFYREQVFEGREEDMFLGTLMVFPNGPDKEFGPATSTGAKLTGSSNRLTVCTLAVTSMGSRDSVFCTGSLLVPLHP